MSEMASSPKTALELLLGMSGSGRDTDDHLWRVAAAGDDFFAAF
jgi:hypothetical protein